MGWDDVECVGRRVFGGERVVRNDDGRPKRVDESSTIPPLPLEADIVGTAVRRRGPHPSVQPRLGAHGSRRRRWPKRARMRGMGLGCGARAISRADSCCAAPRVIPMRV